MRLGKSRKCGTFVRFDSDAHTFTCPKCRHENEVPLQETRINSADGADALAEQAHTLIAKGEYCKAFDYLEAALLLDRENAKAYIGRTLITKNLRREEDLEKPSPDLVNDRDFQSALEFARGEYREKLLYYRNESAYRYANKKVYLNEKAGEYIAILESLGDYKDAAKTAERMRKSQNLSRSLSSEGPASFGSSRTRASDGPKQMKDLRVISRVITVAVIFLFIIFAVFFILLR